MKKLQTSATGDHLGRMFIKLHHFFSFVLCLNFCEPDHFFFFLSHPFSPSNLRYFWTLGFLRYSVFLTMFYRAVLSSYITDLGKLDMFVDDLHIYVHFITIKCEQCTQYFCLHFHGFSAKFYGVIGIAKPTLAPFSLCC